MQTLRNRRVQAATKALILLSALAVFGCKEPQYEKGVKMGKPQIARPVEELADARKAKRDLDAGNLQVVPVSETKKDVKTGEKPELVPMRGAMPKKPIRIGPRIQ